MVTSYEPMETPAQAPAPPRHRQKRVRAWQLAVLFALGGLAGFLLVPGHGGEGHVAAAMDGEPVPLEGDEARTREAIASIARAYVRRAVVLRAPGGWERTRTREELGAHVEADRIAALAVEARDPASALRRASRGAREAVRLPLPVVLDAERARAALLAIKDELDNDPVNARIDLTAGTTIQDEAGREVDVYATLARLDEALANGAGQIDIAALMLEAKRKAADVEGAKLDTVLGVFEARLVDPKREERALRVAASKISGQFILPGETFDLNEEVGSLRAGDASEASPSGESRIASALHAAAFFAGLEIVERHPRVRAGASIPMGLEALVAHPAVTLRLRNPYAEPVVIDEKVQGGTLRAEVRGASRARDVTFARRIDEVVPFAEREVPDVHVPRGVRVLAQRGVPGFAITRDRIVREGAVTMRDRVHERYAPVPQIWHVGAGDADVHFKPHEDTHPEVVADEYLTMAAGADGAGIITVRVPGRTGTKGWTVREGLTKSLAGRGGDDLGD